MWLCNRYYSTQTVYTCMCVGILVTSSSRLYTYTLCSLLVANSTAYYSNRPTECACDILLHNEYMPDHCHVQLASCDLYPVVYFLCKSHADRMPTHLHGSPKLHVHQSLIDLKVVHTCTLIDKKYPQRPY